MAAVVQLKGPARCRLVHPMACCWCAQPMDFLPPAFKVGEIGALHPHLFVGDQSFGFWGGMFRVRAERRSAFYKALGKGPEAIFLIQSGISAGASGEPGIPRFEEPPPAIVRFLLMLPY